MIMGLQKQIMKEMDFLNHQLVRILYLYIFKHFQNDMYYYLFHDALIFFLYQFQTLLYEKPNGPLRQEQFENTIQQPN